MNHSTLLIVLFFLSSFVPLNLLAGPEDAAALIEAALERIPVEDEHTRSLLISARKALEAPKEVAAQIPNDVAPTESVEAGNEKAPDLDFASLREAGFRLQQGPGSSKPDINPATFSFEKNIESGSSASFGSQFFLGWSPNRKLVENEFTGEEEYQGTIYLNDNAVIFYETSIQGNLSTQTPDSADAWRFRVGGEIDHSPESVIISAGNVEQFHKEHGRYPSSDEMRSLTAGHLFYQGSYTSFAAKYETDFDFETGRAGFEMMWTPSTSLPGNGKGLKIGEFANFNWRTYAGIDAGSETGSGRSDFADEPLWLIARGTANLSLEFLEKMPLFKEVDLFIDNNFRYLTDSEQSYNFLTTGINFGFSDNVGLQFDYRVGKDSPNFEKIEIVTGALSLTF